MTISCVLSESKTMKQTKIIYLYKQMNVLVIFKSDQLVNKRWMCELL